MKLPTAIATLFLVTSTALPAFAAMPASTSLREAAATPIETVQYRQTPRQTQRDRTQRPTNARPREIAPGWGHCEARSAGEGNYSAYPSWDICDNL